MGYHLIMPFFSIVIPVYNVENYLAECLDSVLDQSYTDFEIIAVNDGSKDGSGQILQAYADKDQRIKAIDTVNGGLSKARNLALDHVNGDFIYYLDSDDVLAYGALEKWHREIVQHSLDILFFAGDVIFDGVDESAEGWKYDYSRPRDLCSSVRSSSEFFIELHKRKRLLTNVYFFCARSSAINTLRFYPGIVHEDDLYSPQVMTNPVLKRALCITDKCYRRRVRQDSIMTSNISIKNYQGYLAVVRDGLAYLSNIEDLQLRGAVASYLSLKFRCAVSALYKIYGFRIPLAKRKEILMILLKNRPLFREIQTWLYVSFPVTVGWLIMKRRSLL